MSVSKMTLTLTELTCPAAQPPAPGQEDQPEHQIEDLNGDRCPAAHHIAHDDERDTDDDNVDDEREEMGAACLEIVAGEDGRSEKLSEASFQRHVCPRLPLRFAAGRCVVVG